MSSSGNGGPVRRRAHWIDLRTWLVVVSILGTLIFVPAGMELSGNHGSRWAEAVMLILGVAGSIGLFRYLREPVSADEEDDIIPAIREACQREGERQRRQASRPDD